MFLALYKLLFVLFCVVSTKAQDCTRTSICKCSMSDGSGEVNLMSLASTNGTPRYQVYVDYWSYQYNPCIGFSSVSGTYTNLAILQVASSNEYDTYDLGVQPSENFTLSLNGELTVSYLAADSLRFSRVLLICVPGSTTHTFEFIGELVTTEYDFILTGPCACPGLCDDYGIIGATTPSGTTTTADPNRKCYNNGNSCSCTMSDGSGDINLKSLASTNGLPKWEVYDFSYTYYFQYNPCQGFNSYYYSDLAVVQKAAWDQYTEYDCGVQSTESFSTSSANEITIEYLAADGLRFSRVILTCDATASTHQFYYLGELVTTEYDFLLTGPCACPGKCNDFGIIGDSGTTLQPTTTTVEPEQLCTSQSTCKCTMKDGSGDINLLSLASTNGDPKWDVSGGYWSYKYNPCQPFESFPFTNLAILQYETQYNIEQYDLGVQSSEAFRTSTSGEISITYVAQDTVRFSRVILICEPNSLEHSLDFVGELITTEYDFVLTGPCACPGFCDDYGLVGNPPTIASTTSSQTSTSSNVVIGPDESFNWNQMAADLVSLIFHDMILVVLIIGIAVALFYFCSYTQNLFIAQNSAINENIESINAITDRTYKNVT